MMSLHDDRLLILDFGSQYTQLIARRIREHGVYSEILPCDVDPQRIEIFAPRGVILSGGPESTLDVVGWKIPKEVYDLNVPLLGINLSLFLILIKCNSSTGRIISNISLFKSFALFG